MKLAEALASRSDAQKRLTELTNRASTNARYQEGEAPAEQPTELLSAAREAVREIEGLVRRINRTNAAVEIEPGLTITDAIARRDALKSQRKIIATVADSAVGRGDLGWGRRMRSELRYVTDLSVPELRAEADRLAREHRELDTRLQEANWTTELVD